MNRRSRFSVSTKVNNLSYLIGGEPFEYLARETKSSYLSGNRLVKLRSMKYRVIIRYRRPGSNPTREAKCGER